MANLGDILTVPTAAPAAYPQFIPTPATTTNGLGEGGLVGALVLLSLLGGNGFNNNNCNFNKDCVDQSALNALQGSFDTNSILSKLASIEAAVPYNEAQVQLALAGLGDQLTRTVTNGQTALMQNQFAIQLQEANSTAAVQSHIASSTSNLQSQLAGNTAAVLAGLNSVDTNVDRSACTIINALRDDGNATRALITENVIQGLRDDKVILANELAELRHERNRDRDRHGVEVTMINNQHQNQVQFQQQAQVLNTLQHGIIDALQSIRATNQAINIGAGTQVANPTNTNTNVRA
jgi:hypothetical protein